jgi:hypothetical protein
VRRADFIRDELGAPDVLLDKSERARVNPRTAQGVRMSYQETECSLPYVLHEERLFRDYAPLRHLDLG